MDQSNTSQITGAMPLGSLVAVSLDLETTGLDTGSARIVQIGAIGLREGKTDPNDVFDCLVNPGIPLPPAAIAVHGISDSDLSDAHRADDMLPSLIDWIGPRVVVGFAIGFDLAILQSEHERYEIRWRPCRSLCVRQLVELLSPNLPELSLDAVAAWLGVTVKGRHQALGDARTTAEVFAALIPRLAERDIRTLAQAERACLSLTASRDHEARAGWHPVITTEPDTRARLTRTMIDSFPFRYRVADVMSGSPAVIDPQMFLSDVLKMLMERQISSTFVALRDNDYGIVTERDIMRAISTHGAEALDKPVEFFATRPLLTVPAEEFVYRAQSRMVTQRVRHLAVISDDGTPVGALSARDLLNRGAADRVARGDAIDRARTPAELAHIWSELTEVFAGLVAEDIDARTVASIISRELRALTRRACELAEADMMREGLGPPPVPFSVLVLGSGGRGESLLAMDQDNAIVYASGNPDGHEDRWFATLGLRFSDILDAAGVALCSGGVMARNPQWRMDLGRWRATVGEWIGRSQPQDVLNCDIFFDGTVVYGDTGLGDSLRRDALAMAANSRPFLMALRMNAGDYPAAFGMFSRLRLKQGRIDAKRVGLMPIFSVARVLAIEHGLLDRATPERLDATRGLSDVHRGSIDNLIEAHRILLDAMLRQQLRDIDRGLPHGNTVAPKDMADAQRQQFRWALTQVGTIKDVLDLPLFG